MQKITFLLLLFSATRLGNAQTHVSLPAYTGYAVPAEAGNEEAFMFNPSKGVQNWTDPKQVIRYYFKLAAKGSLHISVYLKNEKASNILLASIAGKTFNVSVPLSTSYKLVNAGTVTITDTGFYSLELSSLNTIGTSIADIKSIELSGPAVAGMHFNTKPRRNAASVHLMYPLNDSIQALSFYTEITVPGGSDLLHSYFMACGFARGYLGMQVNSPTERRIIFSVWDAGNEAKDRNKVNEENKVVLVAKGEGVYADGFGNEGTGGHSHWIYNWKAGETYKFLVTAAIDSAAHTTTYAGYFFDPLIQKWKLLACFKAPKDGNSLHHLYSFLENFSDNNGQLYRKAYYGNQWVRTEKGDWIELTRSTFSYDATGKAGDRIDLGGGVEKNRFYLWNGGFQALNARFGDVFIRAANKSKPVIDLIKNTDSSTEVAKEKEAILKEIASGKLDITGSDQGVYYKILKEGTGEKVNINDTLVVYYKGQLLSGKIFDQTGDKPATFPLKRLIKGWQIGLPFCRKGGKIRLIIPSTLAYSIRNMGVIPPNSTLIFDVEVVDIKHEK